MTTVRPAPPAGLRHHLAIPRPRRFPIGLALLASVGVFATSLASLPSEVLAPAAVLWFGALLAGLLAPRPISGPLLTVAASAAKPLTALLVVWALTHGPGSAGPHSALDWCFLGPLNAGTGLWLLAVIRHRAA